jgi:hypothetical protein
MMRGDDDYAPSYVPVLLRIVLLAAVVTAVPVVLWTITAFMRTYVAQPVIPGARPLAATPANAAADATPTGTATNSSPAIAATTPAGSSNSDADARGNRLQDGNGNATAGNPPLATPTVVAYAPSATPTAAQIAPPDKTVVQASPAPAVPAPDAAANPWPTSSSQAQQPTVPPAATDATAADDLPAPDPLTGPVPLPPHRPRVFALAETDIPLPRARPAIAPEPAPAASDAPSSSYDPGLSHY